MTKRDRLAAMLAAAMLSLTAVSQAGAKQIIELAFVLGTTGSTGSLIRDAQPPPFRASPNEERSTALEQQSTERKDLNAKLADLVAKRDAYIVRQRAKQQPKTASSFDQAVAATLKAQVR